MPTLLYDAKWTVLDTENADASETFALCAHLAPMTPEDAKAYIRTQLLVDIGGDMKAASELSLYVGEITFPQGRVDIKHLSVEWDSSLSAEEYSEEFGEALYMELQHQDACIPFMAFESFQIRVK